MKKFMFVLFSAAALASQASVLWWQVDATDYSGLPNVDGVGAVYLYATKDGQSNHVQTGLVGETWSFDMSKVDYSGYSFYIEAVNYGQAPNVAVARSETKSYAELSGHITSSLSQIPQLNAWHGGTYSAVPEPTSGFLMMVGLALLGLKRRKV